MTSQRIFTGMKAIDLLTPIPNGGDILITGDPKAAARLLGTEMICRLATNPRDRYKVAVFADSTFEDFADYEKEFGVAVPSGAEFIKSGLVTADDIRAQRDTGRDVAGDIVVAASKRASFIETFRSAVRNARSASEPDRPLTALVVTEELVPAGFDVTLFLARALAAEGLYPPIDIRKSSSIAHSDSDPATRDVVESLRRTLTAVLDELHPGALKDQEWAYNRDAAKHPALQAFRFMSQPYFCAEPYTGIKAAFVPLEKTIETVRAIAAGRYQGTPPQSFSMRNELTE